MRDRDELDIERAKIDAAARGHNCHRNFRRIALGLELGLEQRRGKLRGVDRALQLRPEIDDGAEMVFVGVRQHEAHQVLALLLEEGNVGHDQIDARQMFLVTEGDAEIDGEPGSLMPVAEAVDRQVHGDLANAGERRKGQLVRPGHHAPLTDAPAPKYTSPASIGIRLPSAVRTIRQPASSMVSKMPSMVAAPVLMATFSPRPAARASQSLRISAKPRPLSQMPRNSTQASDNARNSSSAAIWMPSACSEVAGVGVPSGAATTLVPMPTTTARPAGTASASSRMPESFCPPASTSLGHFRANLNGSAPPARKAASTLTARTAASSESPAANTRVTAAAGGTAMPS